MTARAGCPTASNDRVLAIDASTEHLARLGAFLRDVCGGNPQLARVELAVTEVVVNAIVHGGASRLCVGVRHLAGSCEVTVFDDGVRFDASAAEPEPMGQLRETGFGIGIVQAVACLHYARQDGWNRLALTFAR